MILTNNPDLNMFERIRALFEAEASAYASNQDVAHILRGYGGMAWINGHLQPWSITFKIKPSTLDYSVRYALLGQDIQSVYHLHDDIYTFVNPRSTWEATSISSCLRIWGNCERPLSTAHPSNRATDRLRPGGAP